MKHYFLCRFEIDIKEKCSDLPQKKIKHSKLGLKEVKLNSELSKFLYNQSLTILRSQFELEPFL